MELSSKIHSCEKINLTQVVLCHLDNMQFKVSIHA